jgi:hypothetical protein
MPPGLGRRGWVSWVSLGRHRNRTAGLARPRFAEFCRRVGSAGGGEREGTLGARGGWGRWGVRDGRERAPGQGLRRSVVSVARRMDTAGRGAPWCRWPAGWTRRVAARLGICGSPDRRAGPDWVAGGPPGLTVRSARPRGARRRAARSVPRPAAAPGRGARLRSPRSPGGAQWRGPASFPDVTGVSRGRGARLRPRAPPPASPAGTGRGTPASRR